MTRRSGQNNFIGEQGPHLSNKMRILELLMGIEQRLEFHMDQEIKAVESRLDDLTEQIAIGRNQVQDVDFDRHFEKIHKRINLVSDLVGGNPPSVKGKGEDRKRLKERLKEAIKTENSKSSVLVHEREEWMEYLFGICKQDGRVGKPGSRQAARVVLQSFIF